MRTTRLAACWNYLLLTATLAAQDLLPGSKLWTNFPADIAAEQFAELRAFYESQHSAASRTPLDPAALRRAIGAIDPLTAPKPERTRLTDTASLVEWPISRIGTVSPTMGFSGALVRQYGILHVPATPGPHPAVIVVPDANRTGAEVPPIDGHIVYAPIFVERGKFGQPWLEDRQWLMRLAYQTGRHIVGAEVLQVLSAADFLSSLPNVDPKRIVLAGDGQGALTALLARALDNRFHSVWTSGYLEDPTPIWDQPEDRILWNYRAQGLPKSQPAHAIHYTNPVLDPRKLAEIQILQFRQWESLYRNLALESERRRESRWHPDFSSPQAYERSLNDKREAYFDLIGRYPKPEGPLAPRGVKLYDDPRFTGYRLSVRVYDNVHAYGILLVPKNLKPGERRPVVFVQHGLAGKPEDSLGVVENKKADDVYSRFGLRLAERGYIVFAPMIATQDNVERSKLVRRAHPVGMIPAGMDVQKFNRVLDYLETLPYVDKEKFSFYGLSYGGYTALWTGPAVTRFKAVISSGHFNDWTTKSTDLTQGAAYPLYFNVLDQYNFGMLNGFDHSDLASLIAPRAFMIEMGDLDGVIVEPRSLVEREISQVAEIYRKLRTPALFKIARFPGPHKIDGAEAFPFLDAVLEWTPK
jgi:dienelactone hydrolase